MGKLKNMMIDSEYYLNNIANSQSLFTDSDYQSKKHLLAGREKPPHAPTRAYTRLLAEFLCMVSIGVLVLLIQFL